MTVALHSSANVYSEPPAEATTDSPTRLVVQLDSGDYTLASSGIADGGVEDDGTGDYTIYAIAALPRVNTELAFVQAGTNDVNAIEVDP